MRSRRCRWKSRPRRLRPAPPPLLLRHSASPAVVSGDKVAASPGRYCRRFDGCSRFRAGAPVDRFTARRSAHRHRRRRFRRGRCATGACRCRTGGCPRRCGACRPADAARVPDRRRGTGHRRRRRRFGGHAAPPRRGRRGGRGVPCAGGGFGVFRHAALGGPGVRALRHRGVRDPRGLPRLPVLGVDGPLLEVPLRAGRGRARPQRLLQGRHVDGPYDRCRTDSGAVGLVC